MSTWIRGLAIAAVIITASGINTAQAQNGPWNNWGWGWGNHPAGNGPWNNWGWGWDRDRDQDRDRDDRDRDRYDRDRR